ncbi:MAG TPA: AAA family ATPase [Vicinamibacteria bacterium]|nr:AAA family ATPase [Vicinamibacteria bacterium]
MTASEDRTPPRRILHSRGLFGWLWGGRQAAADRFGRYRLLSLLGEGGMGRVHLAEDDDLRRKVALKVLRSADDTSRRRFLREARAAARVNHPNLCPIYEVGEHAGQPFIVMELLGGETVYTRLREGPLPAAKAVELGLGLLEGLAALHDAGVVHRDVKPSNLFLTPHGVRLVDFGLAQEAPDALLPLDSTSNRTEPGALVGTPGYMAPEQILGHPVDPRTDIFAAGALLHEALTGRRTFAGDSAAAVLSATLYEEPAPLAGSPEAQALEGPLRRALAKRPADRWASARDMADALRAASRTTAVTVAPVRREEFVGRREELAWLEERFAAALAGAGGVVFVTGERGSGKSALVGEFLRRVRTAPQPVTVVAGRCVEAEGPASAFLPFLDATGRLLTSHGREEASALLRTYAPTVCVQMPAGLLPDPDGSLRRQTAGATKERLIREGGDFMEAACRRFPIVLLIEELQWADPASVDLLRHFGARLARQRTLLIGTFRQADVDEGNPHLRRCVLDLKASGSARELALGPLAQADIAAYLDARFPGHRFPEGLAASLHARTDGLALFVRSLSDVLAERGDIVREGDGFALARDLGAVDFEPTAGLRDLVRRQLDGLAASERDILEVASVAGGEFVSPIVAHLVSRPEREVEEDLRRLARVRRLVVEVGEETLPDGTVAARYRFAHGLYSAVLREDLVPSRRLALHREIGARLLRHWGTDAPRIADEIARHCEEGHDHERALVFRGQAADNAARLFAYAEAEEHYDWAFRSLEKAPAESRPSAALSLHRRRAAVRLAQARFDAATADYTEMLALARATGTGSAERAALAGLCDTLFFAQRVEEMSARASELLEVATRAGAEDDVEEARARIGQVRVCEGHLFEAAPVLDDTIARARQRGLRVALKIGLAYRGFVHYWQTEYQAAEAISVQAAAAAAEVGDGFYALASRMFLGLSRANLGRVSEALDDLHDSIGEARRNDDRYWLIRILSNLGWVYREMGALDRAREWDTQAVALARERPTWGMEAGALLNLCVDHVREGRAEEASAIFAELEAKAARTTWMSWMNDLRLAAAQAEHWEARGEPAQAEEHAMRLACVADDLGSRNYRCAAERIRAGAAMAQGAGLDSAAERLSAALAALRRTPAPLEAWKSARVLAALRQGLGDAEGARTALAESAAAIEAIASGTRDEQLRGTFLALPQVREVREGHVTA